MERTTGMKKRKSSSGNSCEYKSGFSGVEFCNFMFSGAFPRFFFRAVLALFCLHPLLGCSSVYQAERFEAFNASFAQGQYSTAAALELQHPPSLLGNLQAAAALRYAAQYERSNALFDECEVAIKASNERSFSSGVAGTLGSVLINDTVVEYRAAEYDGVMVNTYKALNFWKTGQPDLARVEFNRAMDRQRRARERFAEEIQKLKTEIAQKQASEINNARQQRRPSLDYARNVSNPEIDAIIRKTYSGLDEFNAYPDFTNPFTTYLAGLFFMSQKEYSKASTLLKEAYGMTASNGVVQSDLFWVEQALNGRPPGEHAVWVIYENGLGPVRGEYRIDLPLYMYSEKVYYSGIALPMLIFRERAASSLSVSSGTEGAEKTVFMASMDRVAQTEFRKRYPSIVTRSVISAMLKTYGQYEARQQLGVLGGVAAGLFQRATTSADLRVWSALPKEFQVARVGVPRNGRLLLSTSNGITLEIIVPSDRSSIVYVKQPTAAVVPVYEIIEL
ncbi:MAG: hypothetical protein HGA97_09205 [Chlorobiaceae bacterium]|nr:hypothetical protein [Chlorobiaceae bacterium]